MAKAKEPRFTSPKGLASYPYLNKPDKKFVKTGEYKVDMVFTDADLDLPLKHKNEDFNGKSLRELIDMKISESYDKAMERAKPQDKKKITKVNCIHEQYDDEGNETGNFLLKFKMKARVKTETVDFEQSPQLFDAKKNKTTVSIYSGSTLKVNFEIIPYYSAKDKEAGVTLRLKAVQVIEVAEYSGGGAPDGFDEEDGYEDGGGDFDDESGDTDDDDDDEDDDF